ncbi:MULTISPECIES: hypothetical protein [unclassified Nostoc]|uniref:hypothetical protein n=1 Tax=unclassified Nostoc TaxID=2593658 RepID=UPI001D2CEDB9|nr:hypothetical protein [Nostoc sp. JL23]MBN3880044.1 hypothetical protein [Nostoc sp. JL23]
MTTGVVDKLINTAVFFCIKCFEAEGNILNLFIFLLGLGAFCWWWIKRDRMTVKQLQMV